MKNFLAMLSCLIFSVTTNGAENKIEPKDLEYLKTLPEVNEETKHWFIPSENGSWGAWVSYPLKNYLRFPFYKRNTNQYVIELFENKNFTGKKITLVKGHPDYKIRNVMVKENSQVCFYSEVPKVVFTKNWVECSGQKCIVRNKKEETKVILMDSRYRDWFVYQKEESKEEFRKCDFANGGFNFEESGMNSYVFIPEMVSIQNNSGYAEIKFGNEKYYLDLTLCWAGSADQGESACEIHAKNFNEKKFSYFEHDWVSTQKKWLDKKKEIEILFDRIIKKGVKSTDFTDGERSDFEFERVGHYFDKVPKEISTDHRDEALACAKRREIVGARDSKFFFRGDKKVCMVTQVSPEERKIALQWIDYPDAFMINFSKSVMVP